MVLYSQLRKKNLNSSTSPNHWWKFDNDSTDSIGSYDGTDSGTTYQEGKQFTKSVDFDGVDSYVEIPDGNNISYFSVATETTGVQGMFWKPDGTSFYIGDAANDRVHQYDCSSAYDVTSASYFGYKSIISEDGTVRAISFKSDGTKMYLLGEVNDRIFQYTLSTAWDITSATYDSVSFSVTSQDTVPFGMWIKPDGTKIYILGTATDLIYVYTFGTAWNLATLSYTTSSLPGIMSVWTNSGSGISFNDDGTKCYITDTSSDSVFLFNLDTAWDITTMWFSHQQLALPQFDTEPRGACFNSDGTKLYYCGNGNDRIAQIDLDVAWNFYLNKFCTTVDPEILPYRNNVINAQDTDPRGIFFKSDGTKCYIVGNVNDTVYQYSCSTAWDSRTATYDSVSFSVTSQDTSPSDIFFKPDGTKMYITGDTNNRVNEYALSSAWDLTTASFTNFFSIATQVATPTGIFFKPDGTKMYILNSNAVANRGVYQYSLSTPWDVTSASYDSIFFSYGSEAHTVHSLAFASDGTSFFIANTTISVILRYTMSTAWNITTATLDGSYGTGHIENTPLGICFNDDGTKMYYVGSGLSSRSIMQANLNSAFAFSSASTTEGLTFSVWIYPRTLGESSNGRIFSSEYSDTGTSSICALYLLSSNNIRLFSGRGGSATTTSPITLNAWNHIVARVNTRGRNEIWVNGVRQLYEWKGVPALITTLNNSRIGNNSQTLNRCFDGKIADLRLYNKYISDQEIYDLYNGGDGYELQAIYNSTVYGDVSDRMNITSSIGENNSSGKFDISIRNICGIYSTTFDIGDLIEVYVKKDSQFFGTNDKIMIGLIENVAYSGSASNMENIVISGSDYTSKLLNVTVKPIVYTNSEVSTIVEDIILNSAPEITTNNVQITTKTLTQINFNHNSVFDALLKLAEEVDYMFYIDNDLDLHFEPKNTVVSGYTLDTTNPSSSCAIEKANFTKTINGEFVNAVWVYGNTYLTGWTNSFTASTGSVYSLDYKPSNTKVYVAGSTAPKVGGVYEVNALSVGSPTQYLIDYDQKNIIFVSGTSAGNNIPASGTAFKVDYDRQTPIIRYGQDNYSVEQYTKKEKVIYDLSLKSPQSATDRLIRELKNKSSPIIQGVVTLRGISILTPGNTIIVNHPSQNISNQTYTILESKYDITKKNLYDEKILTIRLNRRIIEITDTIKNLINDVKDLQNAESVGLDTIYPRVEFATGSVGFRVSTYSTYSRSIGNCFILGHPINGILGSPALGINGSQIVLGSASMGAWTLIESGGEL